MDKLYDARCMILCCDLIRPTHTVDDNRHNFTIKKLFSASLQLFRSRSPMRKIARHDRALAHVSKVCCQSYDAWLLQLSYQSCLYTFRRGDCLLFRHGAFSSSNTSRTTTAPAPHAPADAVSSPGAARHGAHSAGGLCCACLTQRVSVAGLPFPKALPITDSSIPPEPFPWMTSPCDLP